MILQLLAIYKSILGIGVISGIAFLLYSSSFVVIHRHFLGLVAMGMVITTIIHLIFLLSPPMGSHWSTVILFAHLVLILCVAAGLYSLITEYPLMKKEHLSQLILR